MTRIARPLAIALAGIVAACSPSPQGGVSQAPGPPAWTRSTPYADALEMSSASVRAAQLKTLRGTWTAHESLALAHLDRAQLTGSYDEYAAADGEMSQALSSGGRAGPCLAAARVNLTLHRLPQAAAAIADCRSRDLTATDDRAELAGIGADVAFYQGRYADALRGYRESLAVSESIGGLARLSQYYARTGAPIEALALLDRAERLYHGSSMRPLAWLALQRGLVALDQGRWDVALAHYLRAERLMPGWWLAEEHEAEVRALRGELPAALAQFEALAARTGNPEHMDAIARILLEQGRGAEAATWIARAGEVHRARMRLLPEAAAGHALEHFLRFERDDAELLALARQNLAARPGAEAHLMLARAQLRCGQTQAAAATLHAVLGTVWNTAELHAVAALVYAAQRDGLAATRARQQAVALNPHALTMYALARPPSS